MQKEWAQHKWLFYPALFIGTLCLLIPALYNHYPLVNPDTATYLASGFKPETPVDRPITYGLLIRLSSLNGLSLWFVVFMQAFIVSWLVFKITKAVSGGRLYVLKGMVVVIFLSLCSSLSWIVSQVQPDVFTSVAYMCIILLLLNKENRKTNILLYVLFFVSVAVHLSHPVLFIVTLVCLFWFKRLFIDKNNYRFVNTRIVILMVLSLVSIAIMGAALSKSRHVFFTGSLLEKGILKKYLDNNCAMKNYKICAYKDSLPASADDFWWSDNSPLYKIGGWKGTKAEFNEIDRDILTTPQYLWLYITATANQAWAQAGTFYIGDGNTVFPHGTNVNQRIAEYFPREVSQFDAGRQNNTEHILLALVPVNFLFIIVFYVCIACLVLLFFRWRRLANEIKLLVVVCLSAIVLNNFDCAAFTVVNGRYGCKMIWLLPLCAVMFFMTIKRQKLLVNNNTAKEAGP